LRSLSLPSLCFFLGPAKAGLLFLFVNFSSPSFILITFSTLVGMIVFYTASSLSLILYASGSLQLVIFTMLGPSLWLLYYYIYLHSIFGLLLIHFSLVSTFFAFLSLFGLPPLSIFWAKAVAIFFLPVFSSFILLGLSVLSLFPYLCCWLGFPVRATTSLIIGSLHAFVPCILVCFSFTSLPLCD